MRVYYRTSKNTGVSLGCFGMLLVALLWMAALGVIAAPILWLLGVLGLRHSSVAAVVAVALVMLAIAWAAERTSAAKAKRRS